MSLLNENSVSLGDGVSRGRTAVLDPFVCRDMRWCANCGGEQVFVEVYDIAEVGRAGFCFGCGEERIALFTRVNSEAV